MPVKSTFLEALFRRSPDRSTRGGAILPPGDMGRFRHVLSVFSKLPYENLTKILKLSRIDGPRERLRFPDELLSDHLRLRTGGTCYSLAFCLREILDQLGFEAHLMTADRPFLEDSHCVVAVRVDGKRYLADPGYLLGCPLPLNEDGAEAAPSPVRTLLQPEGETGAYGLYSERGGEMVLRYRFRDRALDLEEFIAKWIRSFGFAMNRSVVVGMAGLSRQLYLHGNRLQESTESGRKVAMILGNYDETVEQVFGIDRRVVRAAREIVDRGRCEAGLAPLGS